MITKADSSPVIKHRPEDFLVFETMAIRLNDADAGPYQYLRMRKRGVTTFEAVAAVAAFGALDRQEVTYAGLKDEDAITDQYISVPRNSRSYPIDAFNTEHRRDETFIQLGRVGTAASPMRIGRLDGNSFRIVIRNLTEDTATALASRRHNHLFLNYYDTQRFGIPTGPKTTHLIGAHLVASDAALALDLVKNSKTSEAERAQLWTDEPEKFFASLDPRVLSFYYSAHASHRWNWQLAELGDAFSETVTEDRAGIPYQYLPSREATARFAAQWPELEYDKYRAADGGGIECTKSTRATVIQTQIAAGTAEPDEFHPGRHQCEVSMFLPSGCYATMAVAQLLLRVNGPLAIK